MRRHQNAFHAVPCTHKQSTRAGERTKTTDKQAQHSTRGGEEGRERGRGKRQGQGQEGAGKGKRKGKGKGKCRSRVSVAGGVYTPFAAKMSSALPFCRMVLASNHNLLQACGSLSLAAAPQRRTKLTKSSPGRPPASRGRGCSKAPAWGYLLCLLVIFNINSCLESNPTCRSILQVQALKSFVFPQEILISPGKIRNSLCKTTFFKLRLVA